eukprot:3168300-Pleurochrysis_carterae.AAC.1
MARRRDALFVPTAHPLLHPRLRLSGQRSALLRCGARASVQRARAEAEIAQGFSCEASCVRGPCVGRPSSGRCLWHFRHGSQRRGHSGLLCARSLAPAPPPEGVNVLASIWQEECYAIVPYEDHAELQSQLVARRLFCLQFATRSAHG